MKDRGLIVLAGLCVVTGLAAMDRKDPDIMIVASRRSGEPVEYPFTTVSYPYSLPQISYPQLPQMAELVLPVGHSEINSQPPPSKKKKRKISHIASESHALQEEFAKRLYTAIRAGEFPKQDDKIVLIENEKTLFFYNDAFFERLLRGKTFNKAFGQIIKECLIKKQLEAKTEADVASSESTEDESKVSQSSKSSEGSDKEETESDDDDSSQSPKRSKIA